MFTYLPKIRFLLMATVLVLSFSTPTEPKKVEQWLQFLTQSLVMGYTPYSKIERDLYLGGAKPAYDLDLMNDLHITHVLTIDSVPLPRHMYDDYNITNMYIQADDAPNQDLISYFPLTYDFIREGQSEGAVYVHCRVGVSRSATVVIAYIMKKYELSYRLASSFVRSKRDVINPNSGFVNQLKRYEDQMVRPGVRRRPSKMTIFKLKAKQYSCQIISVTCLIAALAVIIPLTILL